MTGLPNLLIIGAAKSGTTAIANYLNQHPDVCMSSIKEPKYISNQFLEKHYNGPGDKNVEAGTIHRYEDYLELFSGCLDSRAIGEASADLLYYAEQSIPVIKSIMGDNIKIVAILRNPIERAYSAYMHLVRDDRETLTFMDGLNAETKRIDEGWEFIWHYKNASKYCSSLKRYMDAFGDVRVYLYDDLVAAPVVLYHDMCRFLSVEDSFIPKDILRKYNVSGVPRNKHLSASFRTDNFAKSFGKAILPKRIRRPIKEFVINASLKRTPIGPRERSYLLDYFASEISTLSTLLNRDLSSWLR